MYVSWGKIQYNEGSWISTYGPDQERGFAFASLARLGKLSQLLQPAPRLTPDMKL